MNDLRKELQLLLADIKRLDKKIDATLNWKVSRWGG
jgi:DNA invertase Pin-like site-specific DNA recombinase